MLFGTIDKVLLSIIAVLTLIMIFYMSKERSSFEVVKFNCSHHIAGLILARGGSKGILRKNLAKFSNTTLLGNSLKIMSQFGKFNSIWVSTDDEQIASEARRFNAYVHYRAGYTATDHAPSILAVTEFIIKHPEIDIIALIQCTSPFLRKEHLEKALTFLKIGYHSVFSVTRVFNLRWKISDEGTLWPENFSPLFRPRRQDWDGEIIENGMFYFTYAELIKRDGLLQSGRLAIVEVPQNESLEINVPADLLLANIMSDNLEKYGQFS